MIWLRVAQGVLCAVEICGLYYLLQVFFDKRSNKAWSNILLVLFGSFTLGADGISSGNSSYVFSLLYVFVYYIVCTCKYIFL